MSVIVDWLFGKAADKAAQALRLEPTEAAVQRAVAEWREGLPAHLQEQEYWHQTLLVHRQEDGPDSPARAALAEALRVGVPTVSEWLDALVEQWRSTGAQAGVVAFFRQPEPEATSQLRALAAALHLVCAREPSLALPTLVSRDPRHANATAIAEYLSRSFDASLSRQIAGCQATGLRESEAAAIVHELSANQVPKELRGSPERRLTILVGELGVGKSALLERLFRESVVAAQRSEAPVVPVLLRAQSVVDVGFERAIESELRDVGFPRGVAAFVEDADALGAGAHEVLLQARSFVRSGPNRQVFLTSRPGVLGRSAPEAVVAAPPLTEDEALVLVARVASCKVSDAQLLAGARFREEVRRPLFAILLGLYWRDMQREPKTLGELITHLVETALQRGTPRLADAEPALRRLGVLNVERGGPVPISEVAGPGEATRLRESRLVVVHGNSVEFALPVLAQWFAAEALADGTIAASDLVADVGRLERWQGSLTIATAGQSHAVITPVLAAVAGVRPSLVAKCIRDALSRWGDGAQGVLPSPLECGRRVRECMGAWKAGLGPTVDLCGPVFSGEHVSALGVASDDGWLTTAWYSGPDAPGDVFLLEEHPEIAERIGLHSAAPSRQSAWAWRWTLEELSEGIAGCLKNKRIPPDEGFLLEEWVWQLALKVHQQGDFHGSALSLEEVDGVLNSAQAANAQLAAEVNAAATLLSATKLKGERDLKPPWPVADLAAKGAVGWVWDVFSPARMLERSTRVYEAALNEYQRVVARWFPTLGRRMAMAVTLPARLVGSLTLPRPELGASGSPSLSWYLEPLPRGAANQAEISFQAVRPAFLSDEEAELHLARIVAQRPEGRGWMSATYHHEGLDIFGSAPVTSLVYRWLEGDLKQSGWLRF